MRWVGAWVRLTLPILVVWLSLAARAPVHGFGYPSSSGSTPLTASRVDVVVVGGDPEGVAAAVAAARAGARTLLIDPRDRLGGLWTRGWLNMLDMNLDAAGKPLNGGIFGELFRRLDGTSFDVAAMERHLRALVAATPNLWVATDAVSVRPVVAGHPRLLFRPGQTLWPEEVVAGGEVTPLTEADDVRGSRPMPPARAAIGDGDGERAPATHPRAVFRSEWLSGVADWLASVVQPAFDPARPVSIEAIELVGSDGRRTTIQGARFIDATQDADLAVAAGARWIGYGEDVWGEPRNMAVTLVFRLDGIGADGWSRLRADLRARGGGTGLVGANDRSAWGFGDILRQYKPRSPRVGVRALNIGRQDDDTVLINALQVFGVDGLDPAARRLARQIAEAELPSLVDFLRRRLPGFETARLAGTAPELYVRTSRQIEALHRLTVDDLLENRDFPDRVAFGSYPLDVQATDPGFPGDIIGKPACYAVPLRSLIPRGFANLFVVGRSAGYDSLAQSSARTVPVGIAAGQGAGVAAVVSVRQGLTVERLAADPAAIAEIHRLLKSQGVALGPNPARPGPETTHWAYAGLRFLRRRAQVSGGYQNRYDLDAPMPVKALTNRLLFLGREVDRATRHRLEAIGNATPPSPLTLGAACALFYSLERAFKEGLAVSPSAVPVRQAVAEVPLVPTLAETAAPAVTPSPPPPVAPEVGPSPSAATAFEGQGPEVALAAFRAAGLFAPPWPPDLVEPAQELTRGAAYLLLARWWRLRIDCRPSR